MSLRNLVSKACLSAVRFLPSSSNLSTASLTAIEIIFSTWLFVTWSADGSGRSAAGVAASPYSRSPSPTAFVAALNFATPRDGGDFPRAGEASGEAPVLDFYSPSLDVSTVGLTVVLLVFIGDSGKLPG